MITHSTTLTTKYWDFIVSNHTTNNWECISLVCGDIKTWSPLVRIHSSCLFWESFASLHCDCHSQLDGAMSMIQKEGKGVIIYSYQEWRWIWLEKKIEAMEIQKKYDCDTVEAFQKLGLKSPDLRTYDAEVGALQELWLSKHIIVISGNPLKLKALQDTGFSIDAVQHSHSDLHPLAQQEVTTKKNKMGYHYS